MLNIDVQCLIAINIDKHCFGKDAYQHVHIIQLVPKPKCPIKTNIFCVLKF